MKYGDIDSPNSIDTTVELVHDKLIAAAEANTTLLIHGGGPNNGTTFYDNSPTARTLTTVGNTKYDSSQYKFKTSSIRFDGSADYITAPDSADWDFGSGDWTWECNLRFNSIRAGTNFIGGQYVVATSDGVEWYIDGANNRLYADAFSSGGATIFQSYAEYTFSTGVWYHIATVRSGNTLYFFINGVSQAVVTPTQSISGKTLPNVATTYDIGGFSGSGAAHKNSLDGWIDEYRISKGIARYTSNFTPPTVQYDSPLTQYVIDGLDGDSDEEYHLIKFLVSGAATEVLQLRLNGDAASNYGYQYIRATNTGTSASKGVWDRMYQSYQGTSSGEVALTETVLYVKSGKVRTAFTKSTEGISGTTVAGVNMVGDVWNNTVDNVTNITIFGYNANTMMPGTRLILLRKRKLTTGMKFGEIDPVGLGASVSYGHWQLVYDNTLSSAATSVDITGLDGNSGVVYKLITRGIIGSGSAIDQYLRLNSDSATNYGSQFLDGSATSVSASRSTSRSWFVWLAFGNTGEVNVAEYLFYLKSGFVRTAIGVSATKISGTTITYIDLWGNCWNNTTDNVTSMTVSSTTSNGLGIGTHIELWRLNL